MNKDLTMQNDYMENSTKISLCFNGDEVPLEKITSILEVEPTYVRKIIIVIHMENCAQPYIVLSPDTINFLHLINAEIVMDVWGYDTGEGDDYDIGDIRLQYMKSIK